MKRGPYYRRDLPKTLGGWLVSLRLARRMTQRQYADFVRVSLRTLISEERSTYTFPPSNLSVLGAGMVGTEFADRWALCASFREYMGGDQ